MPEARQEPKSPYENLPARKPGQVWRFLAYDVSIDTLSYLFILIDEHGHSDFSDEWRTMIREIRTSRFDLDSISFNTSNASNWKLVCE